MSKSAQEVNGAVVDGLGGVAKRLEQVVGELHAYLNDNDLPGCRLCGEIGKLGQAKGLVQEVADELAKSGLPTV